jgi:hypothetical protein
MSLRGNDEKHALHHLKKVKTIPMWFFDCKLIVHQTSGSYTKTTRPPTQWFALTRFCWKNRSRPLARSRTVWLPPLPYHEESFEGIAFGNRGRDSGGYDDNSKQKNCFWKCCNSCKNAGVHMSVAAGGNCSSSPPTTHRITVEVSTPPPHGSLICPESYVKTDGQPASLSWNKGPICGLRSDFYYCLTVAVLLMWGALSDLSCVSFDLFIFYSRTN